MGKTLTLFAISIYARAVRDVPIQPHMPDDQVRVEMPQRKTVRKNIPYHMPWSVLADSEESALRVGRFRAKWMYPKGRGFVEWHVSALPIDGTTVRAMLLGEEMYDESDNGFSN